MANHTFGEIPFATVKGALYALISAFFGHIGDLPADSRTLDIL
jgi:hypothetical protein